MLQINGGRKKLPKNTLTENNCTPMTAKMNKNKTVITRILITFFNE